MTIADVLAGRASWHVACADVREGLAMIPDGSVHVVCTSPPYWGLRAYGTDPQVWGGIEGCLCPERSGPHDWADGTDICRRCGIHWDDRHDWETSAHGLPGSYGEQRRKSKKLAAYPDQRPILATAFCQQCGAWRGELGSEPTPELFVAHLVEVFREVWRCLRDDGTLWLNIGDSYAGSGKGPSNSLQPEASQLGKRNTSQFASGQAPTQWTSVPAGLKPKDLCLIPERLALALQADGWWIRSRIAWCKTSAMPESVTDRPTSAWEHIWLLTKAQRYFYDADAVRQPVGGWVERDRRYGTDGNGRDRSAEPWLLEASPAGPHRGFHETNYMGANLRNYWMLGPEPLREQHYAAYPGAIPERAILAGTSAKGVCCACGAPWRRALVQRGESTSDRARENGRTERASAYPEGAAQSLDFAGSHWKLPPRERETTGWKPSCSCPTDEEPVPALVLDPFAGAGTTVLEAVRHGRRGIGLELNPSYAEMARRRIIGDAPLLTGALEGRGG